MTMKLHAMPIVMASALLATLVPASAKPLSQPAAQHRDACIEAVVPSGSHARPAPACYATFAAAIRAATRGRVNLPPHTAAGSVTPDQLDQAPPAARANYVISIDYKQPNFTGRSLTWYGTSKCGSFYAKSMPSGWNDAVQSVQTYSGCASTLYWNNNFGQPEYPIHVNASPRNLGSFDRQTSSQKWCHTYP